MLSLLNLVYLLLFYTVVNHNSPIHHYKWKMTDYSNPYTYPALPYYPPPQTLLGPHSTLPNTFHYTTIIYLPYKQSLHYPLRQVWWYPWVLVENILPVRFSMYSLVLGYLVKAWCCHIEQWH